MKDPIYHIDLMLTNGDGVIGPCRDILVDRDGCLIVVWNEDARTVYAPGRWLQYKWGIWGVAETPSSENKPAL